MSSVSEPFDIFSSGHQACPGCNEALAIRYIVNILGPDTIAVVPPSCIAIICGPQPYSSLRIPVYQCSFESTAVSAAGIRRALKAQGNDHTTVLALAGDGGTYDIGLQSLSATAERNEDVLYVCLDNEGYMNTGAQKSSATPYLARTASTPSGKPTAKKNLAAIMADHGIPYVATVSTGYLDDLRHKVEKAKGMRGMRFLLVLTPCIDGWGLADSEGVKAARMAVDTGIFPLYEVEDGNRYTLNHGSKGLSVRAYLETQRRYRHLSEDQVAAIEQETDEAWQCLVRRMRP